MDGIFIEALRKKRIKVDFFDSLIPFLDISGLRLKRVPLTADCFLREWETLEDTALEYLKIKS